MYLLASLPESFSVLVTALEACPEVPEMDVVTERLLHEERKLNARGDAVDEKALTIMMKAKQANSKKKGPCHHCGRRVLKVIGRGTIGLLMRLPSGKVKRCVLQDVLHVPDLSCNLVSVSKVSEMGKVTEFDGSGCVIKNSNGTVIAVAVRCGRLYFLDCHRCEQVNLVGENEELWHKRYGHLSNDRLTQLAVKQMVNGFKLDSKRKISFCEACPKANITIVFFLLLVVGEPRRFLNWCIRMFMASCVLSQLVVLSTSSLSLMTRVVTCGFM